LRVQSHQQCHQHRERFVITLGPPFRPGRSVAFSSEGDVIVRAGRWVRDYKANHTISGSMVNVGKTTPEGSMADTITCVRQPIPLHTNYQLHQTTLSQPFIIQQPFIVEIGLFLVTRFFAAKILSEKMKNNKQERKTLKDHPSKRNTG